MIIDIDLKVTLGKKLKKTIVMGTFLDNTLRFLEECRIIEKY